MQIKFDGGLQLAVPDESTCEQGWLQFRQDKCYRFVHIRLAFDDAETLCNNLYGGHLPSIHSQEEQYMITQFLASVNVKNGSEIWLGGRQMDFHNYNWGDGSMFNYSYWDHGEPNFPAEKCIEMSWRNGRWNDINCRLKRAVLCEKTVTSRHLSNKPNLNQNGLQYVNCIDESTNCNTTGIGPTPSGFSAPSVPPIPATLLSNTTNNITNHLLSTNSTLLSDNSNGPTTNDASNPMPAQQTNGAAGNDSAITSSNNSSQTNLFTLPSQDQSTNHESSILDPTNRNSAPPSDIATVNNSSPAASQQVLGEGVAIPMSVGQLISAQQQPNSGNLADLLSAPSAPFAITPTTTLDEPTNQAINEQKASPVISVKQTAASQIQLQQQATLGLTDSLAEHPKQQLGAPVVQPAPIVSTFDSSVVVPLQQQQQQAPQQSPSIINSNSEQQPASIPMVKSAPTASIATSNTREIINKLPSPQSTNINVDSIKQINDHQPSIPKQLKEIVPS